MHVHVAYIYLYNVYMHVVLQYECMHNHEYNYNDDTFCLHFCVFEQENRFAKCDMCVLFRRRLEVTTNPEERAALQQEREDHNRLQM